MKIRIPYQIILLCVLVLIIFYPALTAEISLVDDNEMLIGMFNSESMSLNNVFFPKLENGGYYRPLIHLSYYLDKELWGLDVRSMHFDNIIMHFINVLLVFTITHIIVEKNKTQKYVSFAAAAIFALHPIVTESVNWISGRTDLMSANFVLAAVIFLLFYRKNSKNRFLVAAFGLIVLGVLSKEAALGMIIASCFIVYASKDDRNPDTLKRLINIPLRVSSAQFFLLAFAVIALEMLYIGNYWFALIGCGTYYAALLSENVKLKSLSRLNTKLLMLFGTCLLVTPVFYIFIRKMVFTSDVGKIWQTFKLIALDLNYSISVFLGASGFYFKKFILPLPLNFYILEIDPLYDFAGLFLLLFCLRLLTRLNLSAAFFIAGVCMFLPALPFAFGTIAWTGYAERYIYISSAFWIISCVIYLNTNPLRLFPIYKISYVLLIFFFAWQTYARNQVWQKNVLLLGDTVEQSPKAKRLRDMYMYAFYLAGNVDEAKRQYEIGNSLYTVQYDESADLVMAEILTNEGQLNEALVIYEMVLEKTKNSSVRAIKRVIKHLAIILSNEKESTRRTLLSQKTRKYELLLAQQSSDPMVYYNLGQKALASDDKKTALDYFTRANSSFEINSPFKAFSKKIIDRLKQDLP